MTYEEANKKLESSNFEDLIEGLDAFNFKYIVCPCDLCRHTSEEPVCRFWALTPEPRITQCAFYEEAPDDESEEV